MLVIVDKRAARVEFEGIRFEELRRFVRHHPAWRPSSDKGLPPSASKQTGYRSSAADRLARPTLAFEARARTY